MTIATEHKGLPIRKHSVAVRGASADALNGALKVTPQEFTQGVPVYMVIELIPSGENYKPMDDGEAWEEIEVGKVARGAFLDAATAQPYLDDVQVALADLKASEAGQDGLGTTTLEADHSAGLHKRKRQGCPLCHPVSDAQVAHADELAAKRAEHGDGEGDSENPLPTARTYRTRKPAAKKPGTRKPARARGAAKKR